MTDPDAPAGDGDGSQITDLGDPAATGVGSGLVATVAVGV